MVGVEFISVLVDVFTVFEDTLGGDKKLSQADRISVEDVGIDDKHSRVAFGNTLEYNGRFLGTKPGGAEFIGDENKYPWTVFGDAFVGDGRLLGPTPGGVEFIEDEKTWSLSLFDDAFVGDGRLLGAKPGGVELIGDEEKWPLTVFDDAFAGDGCLLGAKPGGVEPIGDERKRPLTIFNESFIGKEKLLVGSAGHCVCKDMTCEGGSYATESVLLRIVSVEDNPVTHDVLRCRAKDLGSDLVGLAGAPSGGSSEGLAAAIAHRIVGKLTKEVRSMSGSWRLGSETVDDVGEGYAAN